MNAHTQITADTPMMAKAKAILRDGASVTLGMSLTSDEERELLGLAQAYIDHDGEDDDDLAYAILKREAEADAWEEYLDAETSLDFEDWHDGIDPDCVNFGLHHPDSPSFGRAA